MVLKTTTIVLLKYLFTASLGLLLLGMLLNFITEEKSAYAMLVTSLGWLGSCASGAVLSTKRVLCPNCRDLWVPAKNVQNDKPCRYCTG